MEQSKKRFLRNMVGFSMMSWISFVIGFISSPILTRVFAPEQVGKINQFFTLSTLMASFCYLGLDQAYVRFFREPPGKSTRSGMLTFCVAVCLGFSLLSTLALMLAWQGISAQVVGEADVLVFLCLAIFSFCTVMFRYLSLSYRMEQNARLYTVQGVVHILLTKLAYLSVGIGGGGARAAILLLTLLMGLFTLVNVFIQRRRFSPGFAKEVDRPFVRSMALYAAPLIPVTVISVLNSSISQLTLNLLEGFGTVGIYTSALTLASTVNVIQTGFNTYWAPYVYENYQNDNKRRFFTVHRLMACLLTLFGLIVTLFQAPVFLLLGERFRSSVVFFPFLFFAPICYCLSETTGMGIGIMKKTYWNSLVFLASVLLNLGLCYGLIPVLGAVGAAMASAAAAVLSLALRTWAGERYYKAIPDYRYLIYSVTLMLLASFGNYLLADQPSFKYGLLAAVLCLACFLFRRELGQLWQTLRQVLTEGAGILSRRGKAQAPGETSDKEDSAE